MRSRYRPSTSNPSPNPNSDPNPNPSPSPNPNPNPNQVQAEYLLRTQRGMERVEADCMQLRERRARLLESGSVQRANVEAHEAK